MTTKRDMQRLVSVAKRVMPAGTPKREIERVAKSLEKRRRAAAR